MPYVAAALAVASWLGAFDKKPSDKTSAATYDISKGAIEGPVWDMGGKKAAPQEQKDANTALSLLVGSFAQQAGLDGQILTAMGGRDGTRLAIDGGFRTPMGETARGVWLGDETAYNYGNGPEAIQKMLDDLIDEGTLPQETIDQWRRLKNDITGTAREAVEMVSVLALINAGISELDIERANTLQAEGEALDAAYQRVKALSDLGKEFTADDAWKQATQALNDQFVKLGYTMPRSNLELSKLADSIDITTDAGREAYRSIYSLSGAFATLSAAVDEAFASISKTTAESVRDIEMTVLDNAGKYAYLDTEIEGLLASLETAYDPATVQALFEQINAKTTQAFSLLDEDEQKRLATQYVDKLYEAEALAQQRISVAPLDMDKAEKSQTDAAMAQQAAAEKQAQAADAQIAAAREVAVAAQQIAAAASSMAQSGSSGWAAIRDLSSGLSALRYSAEVS